MLEHIIWKHSTVFVEMNRHMFLLEDDIGDHIMK